MGKPAGKFRSPNQTEHWISERIFVREDMNHPEFADASLATCRLPQGGKTQLHSLDIDEVYIIQSGAGRLLRGGVDAIDVETGDCVYIPAGRSQCIENTGSSDLIFQTLCIPRFTHAAYTALED